MLMSPVSKEEFREIARGTHPSAGNKMLNDGINPLQILIGHRCIQHENGQHCMLDGGEVRNEQARDGVCPRVALIALRV